MFFPTGGGVRGVAKVYERKDLFDRLKDMEMTASMKQKGNLDQTTLTPEDVSNLFANGDKIVWRHLDEYSLGVFSLNHQLRIACVYIMLSKWFDRIVFISICANALVIAADSPLSNENDNIFDSLEIVFNVIFLFEFIVKLICLGGYGNKSGYFRDSWNRIDCAVLVFGWLPYLMSLSGIEGIKNFSFVRVIRVLKVLKTINAIPGLKRLVKAVLDAIPHLINVAHLLTIIFFLFGILGTQLFQGKLRQRCFPLNTSTSFETDDMLCSTNGNMGSETCSDETPICSAYNPDTNHPNSNENVYQNFDNTPVSFLTIFVVISLEGWSAVMFDIMETVGYAGCVYFVVLVVLGAYFVINLVIAVIYQSYIDTVSELQSHESSFRVLVKMEEDENVSSRSSLQRSKSFRRQHSAAAVRERLTERQSSIVIKRQPSTGQPRALQRQHTTDASRAVLHRQLSGSKKSPASLSRKMLKRGLIPRSIHNFFRQNAHYIAFKRFCQKVVSKDIFDIVIVFVILFNIGIIAMQANGNDNNFVELANVLCTVVFCVELLMQIIACELIPFFSSGFNILDFFIVFVSVVEVVNTNGSTSLSIFKILRVMRIFKLFRKWESLQQLITAIYESGQGLGYFSVVLVLFLFVFSLAGVSLFAGKLPHDSRSNFDTLFISFVTTFQLVTGENWNEILYQTMNYDPSVGGIYCILVYTLGTLVVMNVFLAILLETFSNRETESYYDQLDSTSEFQSYISMMWETFTTSLKKLCDCGHKARESNCTMGETGEEQISRVERDDSISSLNIYEMSPSRHSFRRTSTAARSKWMGWSDLNLENKSSGDKFLEDDALCRRILSTIPLAQYHRGGQVYPDCFTAVEVVDCLLDNEIVDSLKSAVAMGQELVFKRSLLPVYVETPENDDSDFSVNTQSLMSPRKKKLPREQSPVGSHSADSVTNTHSDAFKRRETLSFCSRQHSEVSSLSADEYPSTYIQPSISWESVIRPKKITASIDTRFADDRSLFRLNLQGEQVTEWLVSSKESANELKALKKFRREEEKNSILVGYSFCFLGPSNPLRRLCATMVTHKLFEHVVLAIIIASSICLAIDEPDVDRASTLGKVLNFTDIAFTGFFVFEMIIKMIAYGVFNTKKSYFSSSWNWLDFIIVVISVVSLSLVSFDLSFLKAFRALRSLRPLRVVSRSPALKAVVNAIIMVTTPLLNFTVVICVFLFTFAILGASLFRNKFVYCKAVSVASQSIDSNEFRYEYNREQCQGNVTNTDGVEVQLSWTTVDSNFDSVSNALLTLFELTTMEAWPSIMYPAMDIPDSTDDHPIENHSQYNALFFIAFIVIGAFFITNLFVGIIVHKFKLARQTHHTSAFLTLAQQKWLDDIQVAMTAKPQRNAPLPKKTDLFGLKRPIYILVNDPAFMAFMDIVIIANILIMSMEHFDESNQFSLFIFISNSIFTGIFSIEILLRFAAVTPKEFVVDKWNRLDSVIVLLALVDFASGSLAVNVTIFRVFRLARLIRLVKDSKDLLVLIKTLYFSIPSLVNIGTLLILSFFVFSIIGMNLFGDADKDGDLFNTYANFGGFASTMLLLFKCMTGEDWNAAMYSLKNQGFSVSVPFFALFFLVNKYMLLNLFIAVILENFETALQADPDKVVQRNLEDFTHEWSLIRKEVESSDHDALPSYCLVKLLHRLQPPLGIRGTRQANLALRGPVDRQRYRRHLLSLIRSLDLKEDASGKVFFVDVVSALIHRAHANEVGVSVAENMSVEQRHELLSRIRKQIRKKKIDKLEMKIKDRVFTEIDLTPEFNCALYIQAVWRGSTNRKRYRDKFLGGMLESDRNSSDASSKSHDSRGGSIGIANSFRALLQNTLEHVSSSDEESSLFSSDSSEEEYCGKFYRPREPKTTMSPLSTEFIPSRAEENSKNLQSKSSFASVVRNASLYLNNKILLPISSKFNKAEEPRVDIRNTSTDLDEIAKTGEEEDFDYFSVYNDDGKSNGLTHINSQRELMNNIFHSNKHQSLAKNSTN